MIRTNGGVFEAAWTSKLRLVEGFKGIVLGT